ncbi:MAG: hypothetical protein ACRD8Z_04790, partial [Nitrososphaeraceae archaeon]
MTLSHSPTEKCGFWNLGKQPVKVEAVGIDDRRLPIHRSSCSGGGATNLANCSSRRFNWAEVIP